MACKKWAVIRKSSGSGAKCMICFKMIKYVHSYQASIHMYHWAFYKVSKCNISWCHLGIIWVDFLHVSEPSVVQCLVDKRTNFITGPTSLGMMVTSPRYWLLLWGTDWVTRWPIHKHPQIIAPESLQILFLPSGILFPQLWELVNSTKAFQNRASDSLGNAP